MNIENDLEEYARYYFEGQKVFIVAKEPSGKEHRGECTYVGAEVRRANDFEAVRVPLFSCPHIPSGHYVDIKINPIPQVERNPT